MSITPRKTCADFLHSIYTKGAYSSAELNKIREKYNFSPVDLRFIKEITFGVLKHKIKIDYIISQNSNIPLKKISPYVLTILECGVYQILYMDRVPNSAAVNESVKLTKTKNLSRTSGFVNAVLHSVIRNADKIEYPKDEIEYISTFYSIPLWMCMRWADEFGVEFTKNLAKAYLEDSKVVLRCNTLKIEPNELINSLQKSGVEAQILKNPIIDMPYLICADNLSNIENLSEYTNGYFYIQDFAASLTVEIMDLKKGETVIDMCAAPGGKTTHIAEKMENYGTIYAFDIHSHKIKRIEENAKRLGIDIIDAKCHNSTEPIEKLYEIADKVLVDAPCSGLGILRKKPDIKYFRKKEDILELSKISYDILECASKYVKKGGTLVFSTCTIEKEENSLVVEKFLKNNKDFCKVSIDCVNKENDGDITLYPNVDGCDGFYICKMMRK